MRERERETEIERVGERERDRERERETETERECVCVCVRLCLRFCVSACVFLFLCSNTRLRTCTHGATYLRVRLALNTQIQPWACTANIGRNRAPTCYCDAEASDRRLYIYTYTYRHMHTYFGLRLKLSLKWAPSGQSICFSGYMDLFGNRKCHQLFEL